MRRAWTWFAAAAGGLLPGAVLPGAVSAGEPMPPSLVVQTEYVEFAQWAQSHNRQDPTDRLADAQARAVSLVATRPPTIRKCPEGPGALYGTVPVGTRSIALVLVPGPNDGATVALDANGNGDLTEAGESTEAPGQAAGNGTLWQTRWRLGDAVLEVAAMRSQTKDHGVTWNAGANVTGARRGLVDLGGTRYALHLYDRDFDGAYTGAEDRWWFGPATAQPARLNASSMIEGNEPAFAGGAWRLAGVDASGRARLVLDPNGGTVGEYFARRSERVKSQWFRMFDQEAATFAPQHGIDLSRPRATSEPRWIHDVDFRAALARAQAEHKPLLVDFEADWCQWCYRFEYYVYRDAEVAALLDRFVPLKVNYEFHTAGEFERLHAPRQLPVIFFLDEQGQPVTFDMTGADGKPATTFYVASFQPPAQFATTLRTALDAWAKRAGGR